MSVLKISDNESQMECKRVTKLDISLFSLKNTHTNEKGNTITYPVKMQKIRIKFTAEILGNDYPEFMKILKNPEFSCEYKAPEGMQSGTFTVVSDISVTKVMSENAVKGGLYIVSATLEEV